MPTHPEKKTKLTKRVVESTPIDPSRRVEIWDTTIQGFNVRVYPTGKKVYYLQYRNEYKRTRKIKIGIHGNIWTCTQKLTKDQKVL